MKIHGSDIVKYFADIKCNSTVFTKFSSVEDLLVSDTKKYVSSIFNFMKAALVVIKRKRDSKYWTRWLLMTISINFQMLEMRAIVGGVRGSTLLEMGYISQ